MPRFKMDRDWYIPKDYDEKLEYDDVKAVIYLYTVEYGPYAGKPAAVAFSGKRQKPDSHTSFTDEAHRSRRIESYIEGLRANKKWKDDQKAERVAFEHDYKVGDILTCSWGYEQTNIDFYQVIEVKTAKTIVIQEIAQETVEHDTRMYSGKCIARPDCFLDQSEPMTKRVQPGGSVSVHGFTYASRWDGQPRYFSNDY